MGGSYQPRDLARTLTARPGRLRSLSEPLPPRLDGLPCRAMSQERPDRPGWRCTV